MKQLQVRLPCRSKRSPINLVSREVEGLGKLGVILAIETKAKENELLETGKQIAMHIAATSPKSVNIDDLDVTLETCF